MISAWRPVTRRIPVGSIVPMSSAGAATSATAIETRDAKVSGVVAWSSGPSATVKSATSAATPAPLRPRSSRSPRPLLTRPLSRLPTPLNRSSENRTTRRE